jgi:hypothetical protein
MVVVGKIIRAPCYDGCSGFYSPRSKSGWAEQDTISLSPRLPFGRRNQCHVRKIGGERDREKQRAYDFKNPLRFS